MGGEKGHAVTVDEFMVDAHRDGPPPVPLMRCLPLSGDQAPKLLRLVAHEGVSGATMFPGYEGVVKGLREKALWDMSF